MNNEFPLRPICKIELIQKPGFKSPYIANKIIGDLPSNILGVYHNTEFKGKQFLTFERTQSETSKYPLSIYTVNEQAVLRKYEEKPNSPIIKKALITGYRLSPETPLQALGDYDSRALLLEFSPDFEKVTIWLFPKDTKMLRESLFESWVAGALDLTIEGLALEAKTLLPIISMSQAPFSSVSTRIR